MADQCAISPFLGGQRPPSLDGTTEGAAKGATELAVPVVAVGAIV